MVSTNTALDPNVLPSKPPTTPKLVPVFSFNFKCEFSPPGSSTDLPVPSNSLSLARIINGEIRTVKNDYGLELDVPGITGIDDLIEKVPLGITQLNCTLNGKTANGSDVLIYYDGFLKHAQATFEVIQGTKKHIEFDDCSLVCKPIFKLSKGVEDKYKWILTEDFIGKGRFIRDADDFVYVQYFVYIIR
ncbi:hypothetical protein DFJ63DRAFT_312142 [Scheffersomyces coipomensis]|uniref:uncharacterized protein n=1 Tax=Scheffersomyces coipomensis TaxID=1788519 RepID=UPI00315DA885